MGQSIILTGNPGALKEFSSPLPSNNGGDDLPVLLKEETRASTGNFSITTISTSYYSLYLYMELRSDRAADTDNVHITFNGDTTFVYAYNNLTYGTSTTQTSLNATGTDKLLFVCPGTTSDASTNAVAVMELMNYAAAYNPANQIRNVRWQGFFVEGSAQRSFIGSGQFEKTSAITQIDIDADVGTGFLTGSWYKLYGI